MNTSDDDTNKNIIGLHQFITTTTTTTKTTTTKTLRMAREVHGWRFMFNYTVTDVRHTVPELRQTDFDVGHTIADDLFVRVKSFELRRISGTASRRYTILRSLRIGKSSGFPRTSRPFTSILPRRHDGRRASDSRSLKQAPSGVASTYSRFLTIHARIPSSVECTDLRSLRLRGSRFQWGRPTCRRHCKTNLACLLSRLG